MTLLITGLTVFVGLHLIPSVPPLRTALIASLGEKKYRAIFAAASFVGLALIIWGFSRAEFQPVYQPLVWGRSLAFGLVPIAVILFAAANMRHTSGHLYTTPCWQDYFCGHSHTLQQTAI